MTLGLSTARLTLRQPREDDFPAMLALNSTPRAKFLGGPVPRQQVWRNHLANIGHWALRGYGFWSVDTHEGEFVGRVGVIYHDGWPEPELAWHVFANGEGKGYAFESALAARDDAYSRLNMAPMVSLIDAANTRSLALATRLGAVFEREDMLLDHPCHVYRHPAPRRPL